MSISWTQFMDKPLEKFTKIEIDFAQNQRFTLDEENRI